jgi:hypothetical protein
VVLGLLEVQEWVLVGPVRGSELVIAVVSWVMESIVVLMSR